MSIHSASEPDAEIAACSGGRRLVFASRIDAALPVHWFTGVVLRSWLAPANFAALVDGPGTVLRIEADAAVAEAVRASAAYEALVKQVAVEWFDPPRGEATVSSWQRRTVEHAAMHEAAAVLLPGDVVLAEGALPVLVERVESGVRQVVAVVPPADGAGVCAALQVSEAAVPGGALACSPQALNRLALPHRDLTRCPDWSADTSPADAPMLAWPGGDAGLVVRCVEPTRLAHWPEPHALIWGDPDVPTSVPCRTRPRCTGWSMGRFLPLGGWSRHARLLRSSGGRAAGARPGLLSVNTTPTRRRITRPPRWLSGCRPKRLPPNWRTP